MFVPIKHKHDVIPRFIPNNFHNCALILARHKDGFIPEKLETMVTILLYSFYCLLCTHRFDEQIVVNANFSYSQDTRILPSQVFYAVVLFNFFSMLFLMDFRSQLICNTSRISCLSTHCIKLHLLSS